MAGKNLLAKQADFRSFYTCLTASRCKGFERILIKVLAPIFDIIRSNSLSVLDFLFVQQSLFKTGLFNWCNKPFFVFNNDCRIDTCLVCNKSFARDSSFL